MSDVDLAQLHRIGFLLLPRYSMIAFANALEACRMANYVSGRVAYDYKVLSLDGESVLASNGLGLAVVEKLDTEADFDLLLVCGGINVQHTVTPALKSALRRLAARHVALGALCTGSYVLADAGLLKNYRAAIHWENLSAIREQFPRIQFVDDLYVIDRDRLTCSGGVAPLDMMMALIKARLGPQLAEMVSRECVVDQIRSAEMPQYVMQQGIARFGHPLLGEAARRMRENVENPLPMEDLTRQLGVSTRHLERLFKRHLGLRPLTYYASMRMQRARELLRLTSLSVTEVGIACGYQSATHFSASYHRHFGYSPRQERTGWGTNAKAAS